jgi:hypothetical protein
MMQRILLAFVEIATRTLSTPSFARAQTNIISWLMK